MSLLQLESFVVVAEEGNTHRAARRLSISQPPLSRRIRALEEELGLPLFERTPRGMALAEAGERLLPRARRLLRDVDALRSDMECEKVRHNREGGRPR